MKRDIAEKRLEDCNDVFADIFNVLMFGGREVLKEDELVSLPTEAFTRNMDGTLRQGSRDIRKADRRNGQYRLICGLENQENRENTLPQRTMGYDYACYEEQIKKLMRENEKAGRPAFFKRIHDDQRLSPVITAVLYFGTEEWERPLCLHDMLEFPDDIGELIRPYVADYPINLIFLAGLPKETRIRLSSDFRLIAEYAACKSDPEALKRLLSDQSRRIRHPEELLDTLSVAAGDRRYREIKKQIMKRTEKEELTMCIIAEELENRGIKKGLEKGMKKGRREGMAAGSRTKAETVARNMFLRDMPAEDTAAICEESLEQILAWYEAWSSQQSSSEH